MPRRLHCIQISAISPAATGQSAGPGRHIDALAFRGGPERDDPAVLGVPDSSGQSGPDCRYPDGVVRPSWSQSVYVGEPFREVAVILSYLIRNIANIGKLVTNKKLEIFILGDDVCSISLTIRKLYLYSLTN